MALILCCSVLGKPGSWRPKEKCIPSLKSLGIKSNGVRSFPGSDRAGDANRQQQAWASVNDVSIWQLFWRKQLCNKDKGNMKITVPFYNRSIYDGFACALSLWFPLTSFGEEALVKEGSSWRVCTPLHTREAALLPKHWPDCRTQVYGQGVKPELLEGSFRETGSDPVGGGVSVSVCQRNYNCAGL